METFRLTEEDWKRLEPLLVEAEKEGHEEYFRDQGETAEQKVGPGTVLLRHLLNRGDAEGVMLFRAVETYAHELTRKCYAAAFRLGKESAGGEREAGG
jgi:hypothetical protein